MQHLWTPWRIGYVTSQDPMPECLFCWLAEEVDEATARERLVLHRGKLNLVAINRYPYNNGHLMIAPYEHVGDLSSSSEEQLAEMIALARRAEGILRQLYHAHGFNVGMNLGAAAGAGVAHHEHLHIVPRWQGDTNFMGTTAETRVVPETPESTWDRLRPAFVEMASDRHRAAPRPEPTGERR